MRGEGGTAPTSALPKLVLQPADLPSAFLRLEEGPDRTGGWQARYRRSGPDRVDGPIAVESRAEVAESSDAADETLEAARAELEHWQPIGEPGLGDESFAATRVGDDLRYYRVYWREGNVSASLALNGVEGRFPFADAFELARKQQQRIERQS